MKYSALTRLTPLGRLSYPESQMAIKFKHRGVAFTADTPEEAAKFLTLIKQQDEDEARRRWWNRDAISQGGVAGIQAFIEQEIANDWTPELFFQFIESIGRRQQKVLSYLKERRQVTDEELRQELGVSSNQALAGILSGISKQAAALGIPARAVFSFENFRTDGKRRSTYWVSEKFLRIATDSSWPFSPIE